MVLALLGGLGMEHDECVMALGPLEFGSVHSGPEGLSCRVQMSIGGGGSNVAFKCK